MRSILISILFSSILATAIQAHELFPEVRGFKKQVSERTYNPENLWDLINGAADSYLEYDFVQLSLCEYTTNIDLQVKIELYEHKNARGAFGIYARERQPDYKFIQLGTEAYTAGGGVLNFLTGKYYVKCISRDIDAAHLIAEEIIKHLNQENRYPDEIDLLPAGRKYHSTGYVNNNFLGYSFMQDFVTAGYKPEILFFIAQKENPIETKEALKKLLEKTSTKYNNLKNGIYKIKDPYSGTIYVYLLDNYLFGVSNFEKKKEAFYLILDCKKKIESPVE